MKGRVDELLKLILVSMASFSHVLSIGAQDVSVSITSDPEGDPAGVYQAATPVTLTCTHSGFSSAMYSWTCSGEENCFTHGLVQPKKKRLSLRGGDSGTHICTVSDGDLSGTAFTDITVTGIGFSYGKGSATFHYVSNNSAIFLQLNPAEVYYVLERLECASGTKSSSADDLQFIIPEGYQKLFSFTYEPGLWMASGAGDQFYILFQSPFNGGVFTCRMPDENGAVVDTSVGIYPDNYDKNSLSVSAISKQSGLTLSLTCISTGLPPTTVTWSKNGVEMSSGDKPRYKYTITQRVTDVDDTVFENRVDVGGGSECDWQGVYQCTVQCHDDYGALVNIASDSIIVTALEDCVLSYSTQSTIRISSFKLPTTISSSLALLSTNMEIHTTSSLRPKKPSTQFPSITPTSSTQVPSITPTSTTQVPSITPTSTTQVPSVTPTSSTQVPSISASPVEEPVLTTIALTACIIAGGAALLVLLLFWVICFYCCYVRQRRKRNLQHDEPKHVHVEDNVAYSSHSAKKSIPNENFMKVYFVHENLSYSSHSVGCTASEHLVQEREHNRDVADVVSHNQKEAQQMEEPMYETII